MARIWTTFAIIVMLVVMALARSATSAEKEHSDQQEKAAAQGILSIDLGARGNEIIKGD